MLGELSDVPGKPGNLVHEIVHVPWFGDHGRNGRAQLIGGGGIDNLEDFRARAQEGIRAHALQGGDIGLVAIARDGRPNLGVKVDVLGATEFRNHILQAAARHGRRQLTVLGLGVVGVAAAGGNDEVGLLAARLIAQAGTRGRILHECAAALDGGQRHDVIKTHAQTAHQHVLAARNGGVVLLYRVIRGDPVQTGSGQLLFLFVVFRNHPAIGQYRGIGVHLGAISQVEDVLVTVLGDGFQPAEVIHGGNALGQARNDHVIDPAQVLAIQCARRVGLGAGCRELFAVVLGNMCGRRVLLKKLALGGGDILTIAAQELNPFVLDGSLEHRGINGGAGLGKEGDRAGASIHAQSLGLIRFPDAAGAVLGIIDEVDGNGVAGIVHAGGEAFQDGNAAWAHADDRDCWSRHTSYRATFRPFQDHRTWQLE